MDREDLGAVFEHSPGGTVFLIKVASEEYEDATAALLQAAGAEGVPVIYAAVKLPYVKLSELLDQHNISEDRIYVVDAITKAITEEGVVDAANVTFLSGPKNLPNISASVSLMADKADAANAILVVDSLESLLNYNSEQKVEQFIEDLESQTSTLDLDLVLFRQEQILDELIGDVLYPLVDTIIPLGAEQEPATVIADDGRTMIAVPDDIARSLDLADGDSVPFTVTDDGNLLLEL